MQHNSKKIITAKQNISKPSNNNKNTKTSKKQPSQLSKAIIITILAVIAVSVLITAYMYGVNNSASNVPLSVFLTNIRTAPHMNIYVSSINNTVLVTSTYCATAIIYQIIKSNYTHRDPSTINFFVVNESNDSCTYAVGLKNASNFSTSTYSNCINKAKSIPSIFINYNKTNKTVVHNNALYIRGSTRYLLECGISVQIK